VNLARELKPDLVVMDIQMPDMDGIDAARVLTEENIAPVLLLTAYSQHELVERAKQAGVVGYIVKPFRESDLAPAIEVAIARWPGTLAARRTLRWRAALGGAVPPVGLAVVTVALCWKLLLAHLVVIGYDTMTYMYPYRYFAAAALREGRLPLWNPDIYFGVPF